MRKFLSRFSFVLLAAVPLAAPAQTSNGQAGHQMPMDGAKDPAAKDAAADKGADKSAATEGAAMTEGEVRKVDKGAGKVTLRHGEIKNLDMPPMTMVFRVKEPAMLEGLKEGDKVRFAAEKVGGALTLTQVTPAR